MLLRLAEGELILSASARAIVLSPTSVALEDSCILRGSAIKVAFTPISAEPAPVLVAMGCPHDVATASVRFSLSSDTTESEIHEATSRITGVVNQLRVASSVSE